MPPRVLICIPCFNEGKSIAKTVAEVAATMEQKPSISFEILVVNDCSTDDSLAVIQSTQASYLNLPINLGIGGAVQCGFMYAKRYGFEMMVQVDGDGQHDASYLPALIQPIIDGSASVVVGSRYLEKEGFQSSVIRRVGIRFFSKLTFALSGVLVRDSTSGLRAFDKKAIAMAAHYYPEKYPEPEAVLIFALNQLKFLELPVQMRKRAEGVSSIGNIASVFYVFTVTLGIIFYYIRFKRTKHI